MQKRDHSGRIEMARKIMRFILMSTFYMSALVVYVFITAGPIIKLFAWGEGDSGGHVLRETTSRGLCGLVLHHALVNAGVGPVRTPVL
jgi:hypothetical protein